MRVNIVKSAKLSYNADKGKFTFSYGTRDSWNNRSVSGIYMDGYKRQLVMGNIVKQKNGRVSVKFDNRFFNDSSKVKYLNDIDIYSPVQKARMLKLAEKDLKVNYIGNLTIDEEYFTSDLSSCTSGMQQHRRECVRVEFTLELDTMIISKGKEQLFAATIN